MMQPSVLQRIVNGHLLASIHDTEAVESPFVFSYLCTSTTHTRNLNIYLNLSLRLVLMGNIDLI